MSRLSHLRHPADRRRWGGRRRGGWRTSESRSVRHRAGGWRPVWNRPAGTAPTPAANLLPPPPLVFKGWTGFYAGDQIGYAWGDNYGSIDYVTPGGLFGAPLSAWMRKA